MNKHLFLLILSPFFFVLTAISQPKGDYVVKVNNDTVPITLIDWGTYWISAKVNGIKTIFEPRELLYYHIGSNYGVSGRVCPTIIGFKRWTFLQNRVDGAVSLYGITVVDKGITHSHSTTSNNGQLETTYKSKNADVSATIWFVRKYNEPQREYRKLWTYKKLRMLMSDCPEYLKRIKMKGHSIYNFVEDVKFYNDMCGQANMINRPLNQN